MSLRNLGLLFALAAVALLGSACLWSSPSASAAVSRATSNALEADTVHFEMQADIEGDVAQEDLEYFDMTVTGALDRQTGNSWLKMNAAGLEFESRSVDGWVYLRFVEGLGEPGLWLKLESEEYFEVSELFGPLFDPYGLLEELGVEPDDVKPLGSEEIRGQKANGYRVMVPARDFDQEIDSFLDVTKDTTVSFWVAGDLPVRVVIETRGEGRDFDVEAPGEVLVRLTIDLFDYGKPVDVEAPADDEIETFGDFGFGADFEFEHPFEGAECYGDRVDECLEVNPETEVLAGNPDACSSFDIRVCLVPIGKVRPDIVQAIVDFHKETANIEVAVLPGVPIPAHLIDRASSQITTKQAFELMDAQYATSNGDRSTFIGITSIDVASEDFGWVFGTRYGSTPFGHIHGVFSYFRMLHVTPYSGEPITDELVYERVAKYTARYTALLHLKYPMTEDLDYLNYFSMYGFSDLDSMGTNWPEDDAPCLGYRKVICVYPDGLYEDEGFVDDVRAATERVAKDTGLPVEFRDTSGNGYYSFKPKKPDWGLEYADDITTYVKSYVFYPDLRFVGITDDPLSQDASVPRHLDSAFPDIGLSVVSAFGAWTPGQKEYEERLYRLILRGVLVANGMELNDDPESLMYRGITTPEELDGKTIPPIPQ